MGQVAGTRVGIVGTGWMAETHTEALRRLGVDVAGVAGRTPARAREVAGRLGLATAYDSVEALVKDDSLAAVHVTSPNDVHAEQAAAALRAGRHVVCEKPLGVTATETAALAELAAAQRAGQRRLLQPAVRPPQPQRRRDGPGRRDRRAPVRDRQLPPGLAAGGDRLELAAGRRPPGRPAGRGRHRLALDRPGQLRHRPPGHRGPGRPPHLRARAQPSPWRGRHLRRGRGGRRRRAGPGAHDQRRRRRHPAAAGGRHARAVLGQPGVGGAQEPAQLGARTAPGGRWPGSRRSRSTCGSGTGAGPTSSSPRTRR